MAALRGFFQGGRDMLPSALSQLVEQVVRVATLLILAILLLPLGIDKAAAGAAFGAVAGGAAGVILLIVWYFLHPWRLGADSRTTGSSYALLGWRLVKLASPIALGALLLPLMQTIDSMMVPSRLQSIGYDVGQATAALGRLGNAWAVIYLPITITAALATSLVPAVTEAWTRRERTAATERISQSLRLAAVLCLPAAAGLWVLSRETCQVLYGAGSASSLLRVLSPAAFFLGLQGICAAALQGIGRTVAPVRNFALGFLLKVAVTGVLCMTPGFGPLGAAFGTVAGLALAAGLNFLELTRHVPLPGTVYATLARGGTAAASMAFAITWLGARQSLLAWDSFMRLALLLPTGVAAFGLGLWMTGEVRLSDIGFPRRAAVRRVRPHGSSAAEELP